ncbi:SH3 domain-containing protein [Halocynthiibacter sp.]|uniref:SH3 domain-containing protein n=1 Tax=Halocynthiibacter sp. TaxID=1979210 RepID=UPI003C5547F1
MIRLTAILVAVMAVVVTMTDDKTSPTNTEIQLSGVAAQTETEAAPVSVEVTVSEENTTPPTPQTREASLRVVHTEGVVVREYARSDSPDYMRTMVSVDSSDAPVDARIHRAASTTTAETNNASLWQVSGNSVNLREGPSTSTGVVASLTRGTEVEILAHHGSWAQLVVVDSDKIGFMSASFLQAAN